MMLPPKVIAALDLLAAFPPTRPIADFLRSGRIPITPDNPDLVYYAQYLPDSKSIQVRPDVAQTTVEALAALLAHEGRHALDDSNGKLIETFAGHAEGEYRAYLENVQLWAYLYGPAGKPNPVDGTERGLNQDLQLSLEGKLKESVTTQVMMRALGLAG